MALGVVVFVAGGARAASSYHGMQERFALAQAAPRAQNAAEELQKRVDWELAEAAQAEGREEFLADGWAFAVGVPDLDITLPSKALFADGSDFEEFEVRDTAVRLANKHWTGRCSEAGSRIQELLTDTLELKAIYWAGHLRNGTAGESVILQVAANLSSPFLRGNFMKAFQAAVQSGRSLSEAQLQRHDAANQEILLLRLNCTKEG